MNKALKKLQGKDFPRISSILSAGGIGVAPTDTIYGVLGSALLPETVLRIYRLRKRNLKKPMIVLVASLEDLRQFGVRFDARTKMILMKVWPGKVSVVLPVSPSKAKKFSYLHRGTRTIAFRMPRPALLCKLIAQTGPLVAPSANIEGRPPARTIREAKEYFGNRVDLYLDGGRIASGPSTLMAIKKGRPVVLRG